MKFAALGRTHLLYDAIQVAVEHGHELVLVGTALARPEYRRTASDFAALAAEVGCPCFVDSGLDAHLDEIAASGAEIAISVNWPTLVSEAVLDAFPHGILNAHAGDLPRYRGNAAPNWAILAGEDEIGVCVHVMSPALDEGPVVARRQCPIDETTYIGDVYDYLTEVVPELFGEALDDVAAGRAAAEPQDPRPDAALRALPRRPSDSLIDWTLPALQIARLVRASSEPFAGAYTHLGPDELVVWRAHAEPLPYKHLGVPGQVLARSVADGTVKVLTGDGTLVLEVVSVRSGSRRPPSEVIETTRARLGRDLAAAVVALERRVDELEQILGDAGTVRGKLSQDDGF